MEFYGRKHELQLLNDLWKKNKSTLITIYGRRRIGKSSLIKFFIKDKNGLYFESLENAHFPKQIKHFTQQLIEQTNDNLLDSVSFKDWNGYFNYLTTYFKNNKKSIVILDEFQWMAGSRSQIVALIKYFWDNYWKDLNVTLILCGSIASFMVNKVIKSKALYGRIDLSLNLSPLLPSEATLFFKNSFSAYDILRYFIVLGTIPKYLELIDKKLSFEQNINKIFLQKNSIMNEEFFSVFYAHFNKSNVYEKIIEKLQNSPLYLEELSKKLKIHSGGGLKKYIENLNLANFTNEVSYATITPKQRRIRYKISDPFLRFYFAFVKKNLTIIKKNQSRNLWPSLIAKNWLQWSGYAFENFINQNAIYLAEIMGFADQVISYGQLYNLNPKGYQFDLVYLRSDNIYVLCEIKFNHSPIEATIIPEFERKILSIDLPKQYTIMRALIAPSGASSSLKSTEYFDFVVDGDDILKRN